MLPLYSCHTLHSDRLHCNSKEGEVGEETASMLSRDTELGSRSLGGARQPLRHLAEIDEGAAAGGGGEAQDVT